MTDNWDRTLFDKDLKAILETKLPVSASKITALQNLATAHPQHHNYIVQCITRFIEKAPPDYRLAGLYVIDAISRAVHKQQRKREENNDGGSSELDGYLKRFAIVLKDDALKGCFEPCTTKDKEKVKKTLDFWEQGNVYSKDTVQYLKQSFLNNNTSEQKVITPPPPVDTASLLATLSNIGNGTLANLNIPGLTPTPTPPVPAPPVEEDKNTLPPALAKLLGGLVSTPSTTNSPPSPTTVADPRVRNDPRMSNNDTDRLKNNWPPPQGPSVPTRTLGERKSRWGTNNNDVPAPKQQDAWPQRQPIHDPRMGNQHFQAPSYQPTYGQHNMNNYQTPAYHQQQTFQQPYQHNQQQQSSLPPPPPPPLPQQQQQQQQQQKPMYSKNRGAEPTSDPSLPPGCIKVLTRTLFVGPIPDHYEKDDVAQLFTQYGELASVIVSKKLKGRHNAFLKFTTRASTEAAKYNSAGLVVQDVPVKVNWAFGFGPKKHFNYDRGDSVIPLSELSAEEQDNLVTAPVGGFQGQPVRDRMVIEEPEAQYRPEWKNDNDVRGTKRTRPGNGANFEEINKKRGRFYHEDNQQQGFYQPQFQYQQQYDPSMMIPYSNNN